MTYSGIHSGLLIMACFASVFSACSEFDEILADNYDRNYTSISDEGRPLGYFKATVPFNNPDSEFPCFTVGDITGRHVEIMFETVPSNVLCFRDQNNNEVCGEGRHQSCTPATGDPMELTFYYDVGQGSTESDITFWVRLTIGPPPEIDNEGMWCQWRESEYPQDLVALPPVFIPPTPGPDRPTGAAPALYMSAVLLGISTLSLLLS